MEKRTRNTSAKEPMIKVSMADGRSFWDFTVPESFSMIDGDGRTILKNHSTELRWRITLDSYEPAQVMYSLKIGDTPTLQGAERITRMLKSDDFEPNIREVGGPLKLFGIDRTP